MDTPLIAEAAQHWQTGNPLEAGRILVEHIPERSRPGWAATVLALTATRFPPIAEVGAVLAIARAPEPYRWLQAKDAFQRVRTRALEAERQEHPERAYYCFLLLAENTAKLTYNCFHQPAWVATIAPPLHPFDSNAGWRIAANLRCIAEDLSEPQFMEAAWDALVAPFRL